MKKLKVYRDSGEDISHLIERRDGRSCGPFSSVSLWYKNALGVEEQVGFIYCGEPDMFRGFSAEILEEVE